VRYVDQLRRYHSLFPPERVLVLIYDDFQSDNEATMRGVLRFLDVDDGHPIEEIRVKKTARRVRSQRLDDALHTLTLGRSPISRAARGAAKALMPRELRHDAFRVARARGVYGDVPPPDEDVMNELRRRYKPEVAALGEYLDRDLVALWGYDGLG
jgi:hypothetical protein